MAEKDATARLRRAVKENNLFLVKRLIQRADMRNPDSAPRRYTSLAWAATLGHEETFEFLLTAGHDDEELSKDSENNTILMLLSDLKPPVISPYEDPVCDIMGAALRMARLYYDRYPWVLDWSNVHGKTALHISSLKGNEELVRMLCDLGADYDLADNKGNTPLHYASSWGHIGIVQLLIERGCQFTARNNEGFSASDYAYSFSTRDTLQDTARVQFENNKKLRRNVFAQAAARGNEWGGLAANNIPLLSPSKARDIPRVRSGSGGSRTNTTDESGDMENGLMPGHYTNAHSTSSSSPSQQSHSTNGVFLHTPLTSNISSTGSSSPGPSQPLGLHPGMPNNKTLSPVATRMLERDADAMEKYLKRARSGSSGTASTETKSQNGSNTNFSSVGPSANGDDISSLTSLPISGSTTPRRRLRPSMSAAQLRASPISPTFVTTTSPTSPQPEPNRNRAGTNPSTLWPPSPGSILPLTRSSSTSTPPRPNANIFEEPESFTGPPSQYAQFPDPPPEKSIDIIPPTTNGRRLPFYLLSKPLPGFDSSSSVRGHRRGSSATTFRTAG